MITSHSFFPTGVVINVFGHWPPTHTPLLTTGIVVIVSKYGYILLHILVVCPVEN